MEDFTSKILDSIFKITFSTKDTVEKIFNELINAGKISKDEAKKIIDEILKATEKQSQELKDKFKTEIKKNVEDIGFVTKKEFDDLALRVQKLESYINELHKKLKD